MLLIKFLVAVYQVATLLTQKSVTGHTPEANHSPPAQITHLRMIYFNMSSTFVPSLPS